MNSIERVETALRFEEPDRVPIFFPLLPLNVISREDSLRIGKDWKKIVEINDVVVKKYGVDVVHVHSHQFTFAEALGLKIKYRPDFLPVHGEICWPNNYVLNTEVDPMNPDTLKEDTETNYQSKRFYGKSPEEREQIKRLSILGSVCEAVKALPGQVDLDNIWDVIKKGYDELKRKIEE